ncbi:hypothetical protein VTO58DRAFT_107205 [Aureobasidium pullulans]
MTPQQQQQAHLPIHAPLDLKDIPTIFLPSPHNRNPSFRLPWQTSAPPPPTPLNTFFLRSLASAETEIYIQTPNLTAPPVLTAILRTLHRGINIHIVTSEKLMILEQLVTAGTTTSRYGLNIYLFGMKKTYETSLFSLVGRNADYTLHSV